MRKMISLLLAGGAMLGVAQAQTVDSAKRVPSETPAGKQAPASAPPVAKDEGEPMAGDVAESASTTDAAAPAEGSRTGTAGTAMTGSTATGSATTGGATTGTGADGAMAAGSAPAPEAQNAAIAAFTEAQTLQASGDAAGAAAKLQPHMATISAMADANPSDVNVVGMEGGALLLAANAKLAAGDNAGALPLLDQSIEPWRQVVKSRPADAALRDQFVGTLVNTGNLKLQAGDKEGARPHFEEAIAIAQPAYQASPTNEANANLLLGAMIGMNNVTQDPAWFAKVKQLGGELKQKNLLNAANRPAVDAVLAG